MELTYHEGADGMLYPDLKMKEQEDYELGKYIMVPLSRPLSQILS